MFSFLTGGSGSNTIRTIDRLLSRVQHSTVVDEKIDALGQLAALPLPDLTETRVAEILTGTLVDLVESDHQHDDEDVCAEILKTLTVLTSIESASTSEESIQNDEDQSETKREEYVAKNIEAMLEISGLFSTFHSCLSKHRAAHTKLFTLRLILNSLKLQRSRVQDNVLAHSGFIESVLEILSQPLELTRNESILALEALVQDNPTVQNIAVFNGVFESLLKIIVNEGGSSIVTCDCLTLISALLKGSDSSVKYFGELGCIDQFPQILSLAYESVSKEFEESLPESENVSEIQPEKPQPSNTESPASRCFSLLISVISSAGRISETFQHKLFSQKMADAIYPIIDNSHVISEHKCNLLRVVGRSLIGCKSSQMVFSTYSLNSCSLIVYHLRMALNGADIALCYNSVFVLESFFYMNDSAQVSAVSALAPVPDSDRENTFGSDLIASLSRWQKDMKCLGDYIMFWTTCRILTIVMRRNDMAKEIAISTALSVPIDDRPAPRLLDLNIRAIQVAFDSSQTDARVRVSLLLLLCEILIQSQQSVHKLLHASHLTETLLAGHTWKAADPLISGLSCLIWAFCLESADRDTYNPLLHRIIMDQIGVDMFKSCLCKLLESTEFQHPKPEISYEPMSFSDFHLFDSFFVEQAKRVIDLSDSQILVLVMSRNESVPNEPKLIPSSLISDELILARSRIAELEATLTSALKALADKTDEAALTRYRLDLSQKELDSLIEGKQHGSFDELQSSYDKLLSEHNELKSQHSDLMILLASLESERDVKASIQKQDERIEQVDVDVSLI